MDYSHIGLKAAVLAQALASPLACLSYFLALELQLMAHLTLILTLMWTVKCQLAAERMAAGPLAKAGEYCRHRAPSDAPMVVDQEPATEAHT